MPKRVQKKIDWTPEDRARHRAIREKFEDKPTIEQLIERGELSGETMPMGLYLELRVLLHELKKAREAQGLSLADVSERSGIDRAAVSRLENGLQLNPTVETLYRYAGALGKRVAWVVQDASEKAK
jgi:predicted transcriptional regulator